MQHQAVSRDEWLIARKALFDKERAMTDALDELRAEQRQLPWVRIDKSYVFQGPDDPRTLDDLFEGTQPARPLSLHADAGFGPRLPGLLLHDGSRRRGPTAFRTC